MHQDDIKRAHEAIVEARKDDIKRAHEAIVEARKAVAEGAWRGDVRIARLGLRARTYHSAAYQMRHIQLDIWPLCAPDREHRLTIDQAEMVQAWLKDHQGRCERLAEKYSQAHYEVLAMVQDRE